MRVLLSAYACEPNKGSEPGVGWHWAQEIAKLGHEVWVLTRENNRFPIEAELAQWPNPPKNLHFIYYDLPPLLRFWKKGLHGIHLYYFLWQFGIYLLARKLCRKIHFDLVHHITFVSIRQPSFLGFLGIPFIFGPLAGGERIPKQLQENLPFHGRFSDWLRDLANSWVYWDPLMQIVFNQAKTIYVTSTQTLHLLPKHFYHKTKIQPAIGIKTCQTDCSHQVLKKENGLKLLYVGHLLYLKGVHLGLEAFAHFLEHYPDSRFTIIGEGSDESWLHEKVHKLGIVSSIDWIPWMKQEQLNQYYASHDLLLFPSLRDSGGMVVLEAMNYGMPVVCLNLGGPGVIVNESCGFRVDAETRNESDIVQRLAQALKDYGCMADTERHQLQTGVSARVEHFTWQKIVSRIYNQDLE